MSSLPAGSTPNTYPRYRLKSGWNALLPTRTPNPQLSGDLTADVAVVGAGFTGLAAAKRWQQIAPADQIAIIDSSEVGEGNPGRNSGFLLEISLAEDADPGQIKKMSESNKLISDTMHSIVEEVGSSLKAEDLERAGTYRAAASTAGAKSLVKYRTFLQAAGLPFEDLDRTVMSERLGTDFYQRGLYSPHCYLAQPAAVIRALAEQLPAGINLFENTPALSLKKDGKRWCIETPQGNISTGKIILANNAFSKDLGIGKSRLVAMYTYAGLTPVLDDSLQDSLGSDKNWGLLPTHRLGSTLRRTRDGRLLVRSHYGYEKEAFEPEIRKQLTMRMLNRFPQLQDTGFEQLWGGAVGFTYNGGALWGEVKPGLFVASGCNGGGTVKGTLLGRLLADLANGNKVPDVPHLFGAASWMPPDPLRAIGFHVSAAVERIQGRAEI